jgi:hypothetical protein
LLVAIATVAFFVGDGLGGRPRRPRGVVEDEEEDGLAAAPPDDGAARGGRRRLPVASRGRPSLSSPGPTPKEDAIAVIVARRGCCEEYGARSVGLDRETNWRYRPSSRPLALLLLLASNNNDGGRVASSIVVWIEF